MVTDPRQQAIIASNLSTDVPRNENNIGKNWEQYMFESMPAVAAVTMLAKLQSDVRKAEGEVLHTLVANIDMKDIRVNELNAYVLPEATTLYPGDRFRSRIFMAAVDTTQRPEIYVNGRRITNGGQYDFTVGGPGEYSFSGYLLQHNAAGDVVRRNFTQKYNVIAPPLGATVAADLMNVLYAGYPNPISVSASGVPSNKISVTMAGGTLTSEGKGKYVARPETVGKDVTFSVTEKWQGAAKHSAASPSKYASCPTQPATSGSEPTVSRADALPRAPFSARPASVPPSTTACSTSPSRYFPSKRYSSTEWATPSRKIQMAPTSPPTSAR